MVSSNRWFSCGLICLPAIAASQTPGAGFTRNSFHVGLDVGRTKLEATRAQEFFGPETGRRSGRDTGYRLRVGYQLSDHFAIELGYADFGQFTANGITAFCPGNQPGTCRYDLESGTRGPLLDFLGSWPIGERWSLDARLGAMRAQVSTTEQNPDIEGSRQRTKEENTALMYGVGLSYHLNPHVAISVDVAEYEAIDLGLGIGGGVALFDLGSSRMLSAGVTYRF